MIDLHMHSYYSDDGEYTPTQLVEMCADRKIDTISLTDHNSVKGNEEAKRAAERLGITYISGIEIDCTYQGSNFHMLGYGIDYASEDFQKIEEYVDNQSLHASLQMLAATQEIGFHVTENEMWELSKDRKKPDIWTGEMFGELLLQKEEYREHPLLKPYREEGSRSDNPYVNFYWDYYAQGKSCYVKIMYPDMGDIVDIIHKNHGVAVLAHPGANLKGKEALLDGIMALGIDGVEAFSSYHTPEQAATYAKRAKEQGLFLTCGSDFHGKTKPAIHLGEPTFSPELDTEQKRWYTVWKG